CGVCICRDYFFPGFSESPPQNFSCLPFGQLILDQDPPGNLERCDLFPDIFAKFDGISCRTSTKYNGCHNVLSKARMWDRKRGGLRNRGMAHKHVIYLTW